MSRRVDTERAMSSENIELVRHFYELQRQGDERHLELLAEDLVYRPVAEITETGEYYGRDGYRRYVDTFLTDIAWRDLEWTDTSYRVSGDNVIVRIEMAGHGRSSGAGVSARVFVVLTIRDGMIARVEDFVDRDEALAVAGLEESEGQ
jgi:ketosteroid isomerase-like protein